MQMSFETSLFDPHMVVQAMRDSRYRHPSNALAELIDNSIDARATNVDVIIREEQSRVNTRDRWRVNELAVLDNGQGMTPETLVNAIRFGGRLETQSIRKIGKYGMGLPTASVSQCRRFDVWSWQDNIDQAAHSYIDLDEIESGKMTELPEPTGRPVPVEWINLASEDSLDRRRGTLVVWSKPDRIGGMQASTIFKQIEDEIGRIYRHFINNGDLVIRMASARASALEPHINTRVRPNDPLYMMPKSSTPKPWNEEPMFALHAKDEFLYTIDGRQERVEIVYSIAKPKALGEFKTDRTGNTEYGRHARRNMGISVVRENREIVLENFFIRGGASGGGNTTPQNRWWGCEVRFDRGCDDLFGVDHNKQMVSHFSSAVKDLFDAETNSRLLDELGVGDSDEDIYNIVSRAEHTIQSMMSEVGLMLSRRVEKPGSGPQSPEKEAVRATSQEIDEAIKRGDLKPTKTDTARIKNSVEQRIEEETKHLEEEGYTPDVAKETAIELVEQGLNYNFEHSDLSGSQMFKVVSKGGILNVQLNINHAAYKFIKVIEDEAAQTGNETIRDAAIGIKVLLLAWARMEDEIEIPSKRMEFQDTGLDWGKMVHRVLERHWQ